MKEYTFDMKLRASVTVEAESEEEAERIIRGVLDDAAAFRAWERAEELDSDSPSYDTVIGECSIEGGLELVQIDGEDV